MSDVAFTAKSRGTLADRLAWTPGARTQEISLADEASYGFAGKRQSGATLITSRSNMPFVGRYRIEVSDTDLGAGIYAAEFEVGQRASVAGTAWAISTNVLTVTVPAQHGLEDGQWVVLTGAATAAAAITGVALQIATVTATTITIAFTAGDESATEATGVKHQPVTMSLSPPVVIYDNITANDGAIVIGSPQRGTYRVILPADADDSKSATFHSDGTEILIEAFAGPVTAIDFDDANTDVKTDLWVNSGDLTLSNRNAIATRIRVEFQSHEFASVDEDGWICFFEKDGDLVLKNRTGATREFAVENVGTFRARLTASTDPNARITELQGPVT